MRRLIDIENIDYVRLEDSLHCLEHRKGDEVECVICAPTVDAIPKDLIAKAIDKVEEFICDFETDTVKAQGMAKALDIFEKALSEVDNGNDTK